MQHLDEGTIHAWLDGELPLAERESAELHAASCAECAAAVAEARGFIAASSRILTALDAVPGGVLPASTTRVAPRPRASMSHAWMAVAAVLVLGVGTVIARRERPDLASPSVAESRDAKSNAAPEPSAPFTDTARVAAAAPTRARRSDAPQMANEERQKRASTEGKVSAKVSSDVADRIARTEKDESVARRDSAPTMLAETAPASSPAVAGGRSSPAAVAAPAPQAAPAGDTVTPRRLMLGQVVVTGQGVESSNDANARPRVVSRSAVAAGTDSIVTTIYDVRGVRVSLIERPQAVELSQPVKSGFNDAVMAKARATAPAEHSITWSDSTGRTRTLRGAMTEVELERLKAELFVATP